MGRMTAAVLCVLLLAAGCGDSDGEAAATSSTQAPTTTTQAPTTTEAATTTQAAAASTTTTTSAAPEGVAMLVTWDGEQCVYEGPETISNFDVVEFTHRNDSNDASAVGVASLGGTGPTYEEAVALMEEGGKITDEPPPGMVPVFSAPQAPELLAAGEETTMVVNFSAAREHIVICFGGDLSGPQNSVPAGSFLVSR